MMNMEELLGLVTVEDILEEIVGEIRDEFDADEIPMIDIVDDDTTVVSGKLQLDEVNERLGISIEDEEVDTIGGWVFTNNLYAKEGTTIDHEGYQFIIDEMEGYQIKKVKIVRV